jgi:hypothetical protein
MGQKGVEIWANRLGLQPVHGKSDMLLGRKLRPPAREAGALPGRAPFRRLILSHCLYFVDAAPFYKCLHLWLLSTLDAGVIFTDKTYFN